MEQYLLAFVTGLTTGGLSCLAVQGGLLASSLAHQVERDLLHATPASAPARKQRNARRQSAHRPNTALPIALFLLAKLAAYTLLGALLGLAGAYLTLDPRSRAILLILIGIFMVGNGLRMLDVHPIFRYFNLEPPKFITRYIRRTAKSAGGTATIALGPPLFLGVLTVFIPCGVTQAMMAAALGSGSAASGALLMFAFTLGTSPVFFAVAYLAAQLGARLEKFFMRFVAVVVLLLGLYTADSGLNLLGAPSASGLAQQWLAPASPTSQPTGEARDGVLVLDVRNNGYFPRTLHAPANQALTLELVTDDTTSCARDFVIPALKVYELLPETGRVSVAIPPQSSGTTMRFTCSMGMYTGTLIFDQE
jgi:sulfite exporter TauE/SafE